MRCAIAGLVLIRKRLFEEKLRAITQEKPGAVVPYRLRKELWTSDDKGYVSLRFRIDAPPSEVTECNCSICRRYGVLWAYYPPNQVRVLPPDPPTDVYMTNGRGFIALAALIFGRWNPIGAAALLFGFAQAVTIQAPQDSIPQEFLQMVPYILTIVVFGKPYRKE
jgi:hypothetical protein